METNYLPQGVKPPLKYIETNDLEWVYDSKLNRVGDGDGFQNQFNNPKDIVSIWKSKINLNYNDEDYYSVGTLMYKIIN